jgi:hypothetical protein
MSKVLSAHADTPSQIFRGYRLSEPSARVFDALAGRVGAIVAGRNTYEDSSHFGGDSGGRPFFQALPEHVRLRLVEAVPAPGVTHLHYEVAR